MLPSNDYFTPPSTVASRGGIRCFRLSPPPPYPAAAISPTTFCYDLSYSLHPTPFCKWALEHGAAHAVMGWGMLVEQAAESFHIWRGVRPDTKPVLKQISISA